MKTNSFLVCSSLLLVLAFCGCRKKDDTQPAAPAANPGQSASPDISGSAGRVAQQASNAVSDVVNSARSNLDTAVKSAGNQVDQLKGSLPANAGSLLPGTSGTAPSTDSTTPPTAPAAPADKSPGLADQVSSSLGSLSSDQVVQGLKEALAKGLQSSIASLGHDGGFLTNLNVKIPVPEKMKKVESILRTLKQDQLADEFINTMNHAAEQAVPAAASVFADSLKQMSIEDAKGILAGPNDAATRYFQKTTQTNLYARFYPIVQKATEKTGVTAAYKNVCEKANAGGSLGGFGSGIVGTVFDKDSLDIDAYVTNKALDGLFKLIADEELKIRQNPVARTTATLQKVFGAIKL